MIQTTETTQDSEWTPQYMRDVFEKVKNWGRWGADDESGALNFITAEKRLEAARSITIGESVSCSLELPVNPAVDNPTPALHMMVRGGDDCLIHEIDMESAMDFVGVAFHGLATSHIDALCHVFVDKKMYNGFPAEDVKSTGAKRCSIICAKDGIVSRGVLLDIPRLLGREWLELDEMISLEQLERAEEAQGVRVSEGDILLIATGRDTRRRAQGPWDAFTDGIPGLHPECIPWLHERRIAVLGCDGVSDAFPGLGIKGWTMPVHQCTLVAMGVHLLDNLRLDALASACAQHGKWGFHFSIAPLRIAEGTGSPVNPIATL